MYSCCFNQLRSAKVETWQNFSFASHFWTAEAWTSTFGRFKMILKGWTVTRSHRYGFKYHFKCTSIVYHGSPPTFSSGYATVVEALVNGFRWQMYLETMTLSRNMAKKFLPDVQQTKQHHFENPLWGMAEGCERSWCDSQIQQPHQLLGRNWLTHNQFNWQNIEKVYPGVE